MEVHPLAIVVHFGKSSSTNKMETGIKGGIVESTQNEGEVVVSNSRLV